MGTEAANGSSGSRRRGTPIVWAVAILSGVFAVVSACYGWWLHAPIDPPHDLKGLLDWLDLPVLGIQALLLSDTYYDRSIEHPALLYIQWARLSGALFSVLVAGRLLFLAMGDSVKERSLSRRTGHVVLFGDGQSIAEFAALPGFGKITQVASDIEPSFDHFAQLPKRGGLKQQVMASGAQNASRVIVDEGNDADTWQTADGLSRIATKVDILAHIQDPWILERLARVAPDSRMYPFSYAAGVARQTMLAHPPYLLAKQMGAPKQHILILGFGDVGQALLREFLVTCAVLEPGEMMVTVVDPQMHHLSGDFDLRHPGLRPGLDICFMQGDIRSSEDDALATIKQRGESCEICAAYIAINDDSMPLSLGVALKDVAAKRNLFRCPIFVCAEHGAGLSSVRHGAGLLGPNANLDDAQRLKLEMNAETTNRLCELRITSFGTWRDALDGAGLLAKNLDAQAKIYHETYQKNSNPGGMSNAPDVHPGSRPWSTLADEYRVANRRAAAHIRAKAFSAGYDLNTWLDQADGGRRVHELPPAASCFEPDKPEFVLRMSALEHRRWQFDRLLNGWTPGEKRDNFRKIHDMLRPFDKLNETEKRKDASVVSVTREILLAAERRR